MSAARKWGILGTGKIARLMARAVRAQGLEVVSVGSRSEKRGASFAMEFEVPRAYCRYEGVLADPEVELVYVATNHPSHVELSVAALEAGKHVLCEKPMGMSAAQVGRVREVARRSGRFCMEAYPFLFHPQTAALLKLVGSGRIGEVRMVEASFGYDAGPNPRNYLLKRELAGGSILDVGCYTTALVMLIAEAGGGRVERVVGAGAEWRDEVDTLSGCLFELSPMGLASVASAIGVWLANEVRIFGTQGTIVVHDPWLPGRNGAETRLTIAEQRGKSEELLFAGGMDVYEREVRGVGEVICRGELEHSMMDLSASWRNAVLLDKWREVVGVRSEMAG